GLAVGACLRRAGREFAIVEREREVGASWRRHYERLHLHTVKRHSALPYRAFADDDPQYVPRARVVAYLEEYARAFDLSPVLGVGCGNTGGELAVDLVEAGAAVVDLSVRGPVHIVLRDPFGVPAQRLALATAWIPLAARDRMFRLMVKLTVGDLSRWGLTAP